MRTTLDRLFIAHPRAVNEDYLAHAGVALRLALIFWAQDFAALVHAIIPALFETTASSIMKQLYAEMMAAPPRRRADRTPDERTWRPARSRPPAR